MSVEIKFEPDGPVGLVAEGTTIADAARRLGFALPQCDGHGATDACAVKIIEGAALLSDLTDAERAQLSNDRLAGGQRLACQCKAERSGELIIRGVSSSERSRTADEQGRDLRSEFKALPFDRKIATLMQFEGIAMTEAFDNLTDRSMAFGKKLFDAILPQTDPAERDQNKKKPAA
jgi:ferredoxin